MYRLFSSNRDRLREALHPFRRTYHREFWALRNVAFEIPAGHTVGILGMNGSGKSTLLQIISSVLQPTSGRVDVNGKVAALLELGAGFNPDLTGRENVVLSGTILGLNRDQIRDRMGEIQGFADIGEFFDQPVRTYSSGMFMRVAFSAALYADPEVLIIDEALSVGDAKFQEKCFRRFRAFQQQGNTILFVTHDRAALPRYCNMGMLLHRGELIAQGEAGEVADLYGELLSTGRIASSRVARAAPSAPDAVHGEARSAFFRQHTDGEGDRCPDNPTYNKYEHRFGNGHAEIVDYLLRDGEQVNPTTVYSGAVLAVYFKILFHQDVATPIVGIILKSKDGVIVYGVNTEWMGQRLKSATQGEVRVYRFVVSMDLAGGDWFLDLAVAETATETCDERSALINLVVTDRSPCVGLTRLNTVFDEVDD